MKSRLDRFAALTLLSLAVGSTAACSSTTQPSNTVMPGVNITGTERLTAVGQTTQLTATATMPDGSRKDVTSIAQWSTQPCFGQGNPCGSTDVATVSPTGLVSAVGFGRATIQVKFSPPLGSTMGSGITITVLPGGSYILSGRVTEAGTFALAGARVEL